MLHDGVIHWFGHGQQASLSVTHVEALREEEEEEEEAMVRMLSSHGRRASPIILTHLDVQLQRHGPHVGVEIECGRGAAAKPVGHVFGVGQRGAEGHDADGTLNLGRDVPHPGADDLQHGLVDRGQRREHRT